jgi:hypothetical protein
VTQLKPSNNLPKASPLLRLRGRGERVKPLEIKSGSTYAKDWACGLKKWHTLADIHSLEPTIIYGGSLSFEREKLKVWGWQDVAKARFD